jgi:hypothetical protein
MIEDYEFLRSGGSADFLSALQKRMESGELKGRAFTSLFYPSPSCCCRKTSVAPRDAAQINPVDQPGGDVGHRET